MNVVPLTDISVIVIVNSKTPYQYHAISSGKIAACLYDLTAACMYVAVRQLEKK